MRILHLKEQGKKISRAITVLFLFLQMISRANASSLPSEATAASRFSFEKVEKLKLGSSQKEAEAIFGLPTKTFRDSETGDVTWIYIEDHEGLHRSQRLGLNFSKSDFRIDSIAYQPLPPDKVCIFDGLKAHYPKAHFKTVEPSSCGKHYTYNEGFDIDPALGLSLKKDKADRVLDIFISRPIAEANRNAASIRTGCEALNSHAWMQEITPALNY